MEADFGVTREEAASLIGKKLLILLM